MTRPTHRASRHVPKGARTKGRARRAIATLLALTIAFPPVLAAPALASIAEEKKLGEEIVGQAVSGLPLIHDYELVGFVREMGMRLVKTLGPQPFHYEFFVVRQDDVNAFAVPGGKLFINAGLIARVDSEDELAGVVGHEVAHAAAHHIIRQQEKSAAAGYASLLGLLLGIINPGLAVASLAAGQAAALKYQRDFEREADFLGIGYTREAGYDPSAMMRLLRKISAEQKINPTRVPPYFQSHPLSSERLTNLEAVLGRREWDSTNVKATHRLRRAQAIARGNAQTRDQVVPEYERNLAQAPPDKKADALEFLGVMMAHGEEYRTADGYLRQAEAAGRNVDRELGRTEFRRGNFAEARTRLDRVIAKSPDDWDTLADLASIDSEEGKFEDAVVKLTRSVELEPYRRDVLRALGRALAKTERESAGFYWFGRASEIDGDPRQAVIYYRRSLTGLPAKDPLREDIVKRMDKLGEALDEQEAEIARNGGDPQRRSPDVLRPQGSRRDDERNRTDERVERKRN